MICTNWIRTNIMAATLLLGGAAAGFGQSVSAIAEPAPLPSVDEILDKSLQATGGSMAWKQLTSLHVKGTITISPEGIEGTLETFSKAPNKLSECVKSRSGYFSCRMFDGVDGWQDDSHNGLEPLQGEPLDQLERDADFYADVDGRQKYATLKVIRADIFDGQKVFVVEAQRKDGGRLELCYAKDSGYQIGRKELGATPEQTTTVHLKDYRQIASPPVRIATTLRIETSSKSTRITFEEITANAEIADWVFAKPEKSLRDSRDAGKEGHPDNGKVSDGVYRNDFFGFTYTLPQGWVVSSEETQQVMAQAGRQLMNGSGIDQTHTDEVVRKRSYRLVTATELPYGTPDKTNRSVQLRAENVAFAPGIQSGKDYVVTMKQRAPGQGQVIPQYDGEPKEQTIHGFAFCRQDLHVNINSVTVYEILYAVKLNSFIIFFIFSGTSQQGVEEVARSVEGFAPGPPAPAKP